MQTKTNYQKQLEYANKRIEQIVNLCYRCNMNKRGVSGLCMNCLEECKRK